MIWAPGSGNPFAYPWLRTPGAPFPGMLPIMPLGSQVLLPIGSFTDQQVFWVGADFGSWMQALGLSIATPIAVVAYVISGTDPTPNARWTGDCANVNALPSPYGTGQVKGAVRRQFGPGVAGVQYGFTATATLSDGTVLSQSSQGSCVTTEAPYETAILSGSYNSGTGLVTLTVASVIDLNVGDTFTVSAATGTGDFSSINGPATASTGTTGATVTYTIATGLTMTITGGSLTF